MDYLDQLIQYCKQAKRAKPIREYTLQNISELDSVTNIVYVIKQVTGCIDESFERFKEYKLKKERACSKYNKPSEIMYVGSSTTTPYKRINEHMGDGYKGTYALHLKHWFNEKFQFSITIYEYDEPKEVIQLIEDNLAHRLKPAFGKMGGNNK